jgi:hypothetical protein
LEALAWGAEDAAAVRAKAKSHLRMHFDLDVSIKTFVDRWNAHVETRKTPSQRS